MAEKLYTIPVNEAFEADSECPVCTMYRSLEQDAIDFTMGPSYMEDDVRIATNQLGFCESHIKQLYKKQNRLGLALMMLSHMDRTRAEMEKMKDKHAYGGLFKKNDGSPMKGFCKRLEDSCYVCDRIDGTFERYIATIFHLYRHDRDFHGKLKKSMGFCMKHYALLFETAAEYLNGREFEDFCNTLNDVYYENMQRVRDDLKWFIDKFDYRYADEPWKNSRDALIRTVLKMNSTDVE